MSNLKEIKRKIKSVHNTQKTTNAMKLVSTAKLRKAEEAAKKSKVFAQKIDEVLSEIAFKMNQYQGIDDKLPFFRKKDNIEKMDIIFVTADKGLCGGFNIKTIKAVNEMLEECKIKKIKVRLRAIGKTGVEYFNFQNIEILEKYLDTSSSPDYDKACAIIHSAVEDFVQGLSDKVVIIHNGYKNMISQELRVNELLPVAAIAAKEEKSDSLLDLEPEDGEILNDLLKTYFEYNMYFALVDSLAAEHSARMQAMDNATNNAKARVKQLNLAYNKARQESITTELIEIISGVESMK